MLVAGVALSPLLLVGSHDARPNVASLLALVEVALLPTGVAYIAFYRAVALVGAARATIAIYLIPLVAMLTGTLVGGEPLTIGALAGGTCALAAVAAAVGSGRVRTGVARDRTPAVISMQEPQQPVGALRTRATPSP